MFFHHQHHHRNNNGLKYLPIDLFPLLMLLLFVLIDVRIHPLAVEYFSGGQLLMVSESNGKRKYIELMKIEIIYLNRKNERNEAQPDLNGKMCICLGKHFLGFFSSKNCICDCRKANVCAVQVVICYMIFNIRFYTHNSIFTFESI